MLRPLGDRIIIELVEVEEKTAFGIVLPDSAKEKPQTGKVVAVCEREDIDLPIEEHLIVELYSK